jgi:L-fuconolactonase
MCDDLAFDVRAGHNVRQTVFVDAGSFYKSDGPLELRCVGETE